MVMGIAGIFAALFHSKGSMPVEPTGQTGSSTSENTPHIEPTGEYIFLQELLRCNEFQAIDIATQFEHITEKPLQSAEVVPTGKVSTTLKTTIDGKSYYLKISSAHLLIEIREDSITGNLLFREIF